MMFMTHIAYMLGLIALFGGLVLFIWGSRHEGPGTQLARFVGAMIIIVIFIDFVYMGLAAMRMRNAEMMPLHPMMMQKNMQHPANKK